MERAESTGAPVVQGARLQSITDLTVVMPIRRGFVDGLQTRTYASRLRILLKTVHRLRQASREQSLLRTFPDSIAVIRAIHSFRLAILDDDRKLLLAVAFDGPWQPYMRNVWRDLGPLLDLILCNCEGYVDRHASELGFPAFADWVQKYQVQSDFFYAASSLSVDDGMYLERLEELTRKPTPAAGAACGARIQQDRAEFDKALALLRVADGDPPRAEGPAAEEERRSQGARALAILYRLGDLYPRHRGAEHRYLLRTARSVLKGFGAQEFREDDPRRIALQRELEWLATSLSPPAEAPPRTWKDGDDEVQAGVLDDYPAELTRGCVLLVRMRNVEAARRFLSDERRITYRGAISGGHGVHVNLAFTPQGLRRLGLPDAELARFPQEFREGEGMSERAGLLGDLRCNHPDRWELPAWRGVASGTPVRLSTVDFVMQLRAPATPDLAPDALPRPLADYVARLEADEANGVCVLAVEPMHSRPGGHLGLIGDGLSQPVVEGVTPDADAEQARRKVWKDSVPLGDVLLGYANSRGDAAVAEQHRGSLLDNGTFLVIRKLEQDVALLRAVIAENARIHGIPAEDLYAKIIGRDRTGKSITGSTTGNDFDYANDRGDGCPLQSHMRLANPRTERVPRIQRRGMSYGPPLPEGEQGTELAAAKRGMFFMAYNASITEQFEVIQRWLSGANSTGIFSGLGDPLLGVPERDRKRIFRFIHGERAIACDLDVLQGDDPKPFVQLRWGLYLFVPSRQGLRRILRSAALSSALSTSSPVVERGQRTLERLEALAISDPGEAKDAWRTLLEDGTAHESGVRAAVWAAIRTLRRGVVKTPYGVLVGTARTIQRVFQNDSELYSVREYADRMERSAGKIFLGMDRGAGYASESRPALDAIERVDPGRAFARARAGAAEAVARLGRLAGVFSVIDVADYALAGISHQWFDLPDGPLEWPGDPAPAGVAVRAGPARDPRELFCPASFLMPSRYMFFPQPTEFVAQIGALSGQMLAGAIRRFVMAGAPLKGEISGALQQQIPGDPERLARTLLGVMIGFLPTVHGNLLATAHQWIADEDLWRHQQDLLLSPEPDVHKRAQSVLEGPLKRAMQKLPTPSLVHRTALRAHRLEAVEVEPGERIVLGIQSATQELLAAGKEDVSLVFGGRRVEGGPLHACPGQALGMAVMLGVLSALLEAGRLRPAGATLTLLLESTAAAAPVDRASASPSLETQCAHDR